MKICSCFCLMLVLTVCSVFLAKYKQLYNVTQDYNESAVDGMTYDQCGFERTGEVDIYGQPLPAFESGWTQVFRFQRILYTIMLSMAASTILSLCIPMISAFCMCCVNCAACPLVAAMILTGIRRLNADGETCAESLAIVEEDGTTFSDNGATLRALFIAQCVMYIPTLCCFNCSLMLSL